MGQSMKRTLFVLTVVVFLLPACASTPAPTEELALIQQATQPQATFSPPTTTLTPGPVDELPDVPASSVSDSGPVEEIPDLPTDTPTPLSVFTPTLAVEYDVYCDPYVERSTQQPQLTSQIEAGKTVTIRNPVNLRTRPNRINRIILILKPGTQVKIIGGPVETLYDIGKYVWWQVELPGGLTGWSAELSMCGRYYFLDPSTATASQ